MAKLTLKAEGDLAPLVLLVLPSLTSKSVCREFVMSQRRLWVAFSATARLVRLVEEQILLLTFSKSSCASCFRKEQYIFKQIKPLSAPVVFNLRVAATNGVA